MEIAKVSLASDKCC